MDTTAPTASEVAQAEVQALLLRLRAAAWETEWMADGPRLLGRLRDLLGGGEIQGILASAEAHHRATAEAAAKAYAEAYAGVLAEDGLAAEGRVALGEPAAPGSPWTLAVGVRGAPADLLAREDRAHAIVEARVPRLAGRISFAYPARLPPS